MNKVRYGAYDLHLMVHPTQVAGQLQFNKWIASATIKRWKNGDSIATTMAWSQEFETKDEALNFAIHEAKDWADAHQIETVE